MSELLGAALGVGALFFGGPLVLAATGFTAAGVTMGSIAAATQGAAVASGSYFALAQSAGAVGSFAASTYGTAALLGGAVATCYENC